MHRILLLITASVLSTPSFAAAEQDTYTMRDALNQIDVGGTTAKAVLQSYSQALTMATVWQDSHGQERMFCQPGKLALKNEQLIDIIRKYVADNPKSMDLPAPVVTLFALQQVFPCG